MMAMQLSDAAQALKATYHGDDVMFRGISTDTRTLVEGNLFVALEGPNFDGHDYLEQAQRKGAVAVAVRHTGSDVLPQLQVEDTQCGAKVFDRSIALEIFQENFISRWLFDLELLVRARKLFGEENANSRIAEVALNNWEEVEAPKEEK